MNISTSPCSPTLKTFNSDGTTATKMSIDAIWKSAECAADIDMDKDQKNFSNNYLQTQLNVNGKYINTIQQKLI